MTSTMTLSAKGQMTLNKSLREPIGIKMGEKVIVKKPPNGSLNIETEKKRGDVLSLAGILAHETDVVLSDDELNESIRQSYIQRGIQGLEK